MITTDASCLACGPKYGQFAYWDVRTDEFHCSLCDLPVFGEAS